MQSKKKPHEFYMLPGKPKIINNAEITCKVSNIIPSFIQIQTYKIYPQEINKASSQMQSNNNMNLACYLASQDKSYDRNRLKCLSS